MCTAGIGRQSRLEDISRTLPQHAWVLHAWQVMELRQTHSTLTSVTLRCRVRDPPSAPVQSCQLSVNGDVTEVTAARALDVVRLSPRDRAGKPHGGMLRRDFSLLNCFIYLLIIQPR